jgi:Vacuolar sorting-associated protein 13, N-terminal
MGKALDRFLSQYFELNDDEESKTAKKKKKSSPLGRTKGTTTSIYSAVWSGYISLHDLNVRVHLLNNYLQSIQVPISIVTFHIRTIEITLPKYNPISSPSRDQRDAAIFVMDGVHVLIRIHPQVSATADTPEECRSLRNRAIHQRRRELDRMVDPAKTNKGWKEWIKQQFLQPQYFQSLWTHLCDTLQIHVRDVHVRLEHDQSTAAAGDAYAIGIILESMHVQHDLEAAEAAKPQDDSKIFKIAELNRFGIYWNALYTVDSLHKNDRMEQKLLSSANMTAPEIVRALDQMICRRSVALLSSTPLYTPQQTYILQPVDGQWHATIQTGLACATSSDTSAAPKIIVVCIVDDVSVQLRDFQFVQCLQLLHTFKEYKYNQRHWRYRPTNPILNDPKAWWLYAVAAIRRELSERPQNQASMRWSWKRWATRQRYCLLYDRFLRSVTNHDDSGESITHFERNELADMEDGVVGDLTVQDILLYRFLVQNRLGVKSLGDDPNTVKTSWLRRKLQSWVGEDVDDDEYNRLLFYWQELTSNDSMDMIEGTIGDAPTLSSAVALEWRILQGQLTLLVPIESTMDQLPVRRIQNKFMDLTFHGLSAKFSLMNDYDSMILESSLQDLEVVEVRTNQQKYVIMSYEFTEDPIAPLWIARFTKNAPSRDQYKYGIQCHLRTLAVDLLPEGEWMRKMKLLLQPIPSLRKAAKFWTELNLAMINSWASRRLGLMAKAETVMSDHSAMDIDVVLDCPILRISMDAEHVMVVDLGRASIETDQLSGFARNGILGDVESVSHMKASASYESSQENGRLERTLWKTPTRHGNGVYYRENGTGEKSDMSMQLNSVNSAALGQKSRVGSDSVLDNGPLGDNILINTASARGLLECKTDSLFYDTYKIRFHIQGIRIQGPSGNHSYLLHETMVQCDFHKSVIPADHTLSQYKAAMMIEKLSLALSRTNIILLGNAWSRWMLASSFLDNGPLFDDGIEEESRHRGLLEVVPNGTTSATLEFSDFDEAEFFDAAEQTSFIGDEDIFIDDDTGTDSEIVSASASKSPSIRRHRHRSSSVSHVSSISEGSRVKRKLVFHDGVHLTAENLARLEEEDDNDDTAASVADSFRSAISLDYLVQLALALEEEIVVVKGRLASTKRQLANFRLLKSGGEIHDTIMNSEYYKTRDFLRLDSERAAIELNALEASRSDILAQINEIESNRKPDIGFVIDQEQVLFSAHKGTSLLKDVKRRGVKDVAMDHNMTENLNRELFQFSVSFQLIVLCVLGFNRTSEDGGGLPLDIDPSFTLSLSQTAMAIHHRVGETIFDASIESVALFLQQHCESGLCMDHLMIGGILDAPPEEMFASRTSLLEFDFVANDEKFVISTGVFRTGITKTTQKPFKVVTLRLNFGAIKFTLREKLISTLLEALLALREDFPVVAFSERRDDSILQFKPPESVSENFDVAVVFYSVRCLLFDPHGIAAALLLTDLRFRSMGSWMGRLLKDRIRVDCGCSNTRVVSFSETGRTEEIFGKSDTYLPSLFRVCIKLQKVPVDFVGGWVLDSKLTETEGCVADLQASSISSSEAVWNCHIGVKINKIRAKAHPNSLRRLKECHRSLSRHVSVTKTKPASNSPAVGIHDLPVRWRMDLVLKEITIGLQSRSVEAVDCVPESFDVSFSFFASAEISSAKQEGVVVNCSTTQFCVVYSIDQWTVLKPCSFNAEVEFVVRNRFCTSLKIKQLEIPVGFPWIQNQPIKKIRDSSELPSDTGQLIVSALELCIPASVCVAMTATITALQASISNPGYVKVERPMSTSSERISRGTSLSVCVASVLVFLYRPTGAESSINLLTRVAALSLESIEISCVRNEEMRELQLNVGQISIIDFSCKTGVQCLSILSRKSESKEIPALSLSVILTSYVGRYHAAVDVHIGETQCLVLPTLVKSVVWFHKEMKANVGRSGETSELLAEVTGDVPKVSITSKIAKLRVGLRVQAFELILSSRDIPKHIENNGEESIGVVAFRLKIDAYGSYRVLLGNGDTFDSTANMLSSHFLDESVEQALLELQLRQESRTVLLLEFDISVDDLQVLRTAIVRLDGLLPKFVVSPPVAGEQRITNAFCFKVRQQAAFVILSPDNPVILGSGICVAHAIKVDSDFVDVLVYISSSTGGMSDSIRVSVRPIIELFQKEPSEIDVADTVFRKRSNINCILEAAATISLSIDGLMFTFVPGGATQLTESPIVKFELSRFALGCALVPVKIDTLSLPETPLESLTLAPAITLHNLTLGCWVLCEVSASYHNRRLVAWEPFVEPWELEVRFGIDFVQANLLGPIFGYEALRENPNFEATSPFVPYETGGQRLKSIGRFFRFPFSNERLDHKVGIETQPSFLETEIDLSFFILRNTARIIISSAMLPSLRPSMEDSIDSALCSLPGSMPLTWLHQFGFPVLKNFDSYDSAHPSALLCWISDCCPLNVNLTGALIETLSEYAGVKTRSLAPHWIRNDSGLVR